SFYRIWINSVTLNSRMGYSKQLALSVNNQGRGNTNGVDVLAFVAGLDNNLDPNEMIDEITKILLPQPLTQVQKDYLKEILIPGLPDFEWTVEYGDYLANPNNADLRNAVQSKLRNLFHAIFSLPEFYLS
ncbi:MAG TPA: hypothetical protein PKC40_03010, partial [Saprospiraceae bacterium]|nr:hypothetical protein [Saprospiraceae bacterium]